MSSRTLRVLGYTRVSSRDQGERGTSLDEQRERLCAVATREGLPSPTIRIEVESGSDEKYERREEMQSLLVDARPGDLVLVTRVDRWSRDVVFAVDSVRKLVARGIGWRSIDDGIDASTEQGDVALGYLALAADHERKRIKRRTVGARQRLLSQGWYANPAVPFGYARGSREAKRQLYLDPVEADAELVRTAFKMSLSGSSLDDIREHLQCERPDRGWARSLIRDILKNRIYLGEVRAGDHWIPGKHPAIIDLATFVRVQEVKHTRWKGGARPRADARTSTWLVRGMTWCGACSARMRSVYSGVHDYLGCSAHCGAGYVSVPETDEAVSSMLIERLTELRAELGREPTRLRSPKSIDPIAAREKIEARRARAVRAFVNGAITDAELETERVRLDKDLADLETHVSIQALNVAAASPERRRKLLLEIRRMSRVWRQVPIDRRREILMILATEIRVARGGPTEILWKSLEDLLIDKL